MSTLGYRMMEIWRPPLDPALRIELRRQQYTALKARAPVMYAIVFLQLAAWMIGATGSMPTVVTLFGPLALVLVISGRALIWLCRRQEDDPGAASIQRRMTMTIVVSWIVSLVMGNLGLSILNGTENEAMSVPLLLICLAAMAGAYCLAPIPSAALPPILAGALPVGILLLFNGDRMAMALGADLALTCFIILRIVLVQYRDFVEAIEGQARDKSLAHSDVLTGLPNRRAFLDHLQQDIASAEAAPFALLMIDLNGFKPINDNYGHGLGDQVLVHIARRFRRIGGNAFAARLGGDEFAIIVPGIKDAQDAEDYAARVMETFDRPFCIDGVTVNVSASVGIARYPLDADNELTLISNADLALYQGKRAGGCPVVLYDPDIKARTRRSLQLEQVVGHAGSLLDIDIVYQPIVNLASGDIMALEALARWTDPDLGEINPLEFLGAAERTGKISRMSERIFDVALLAASSWPAHVNLAINMSSVQLRNPSVPLMLARMLDYYRFSPTRLEIELAETVFLKDLEATRHTLGLLRDLGVRIILDNFGAASASLTCLKEIPFDLVKLDGKLLRDIHVDDAAQSLIAGVVQLCRTMGIECGAAMIESGKQRDVLRRLGCQRGQGYLFGRPMPAEDIAVRLNPPDTLRQYSALLAFGDAKKAV